MNATNVLTSFLLLFSVWNLTKVSARTRSLKIIVPSKIRYVHHHHTHILVMKDKKPYRGPDAKYHHLHFYDPSGRKPKDTNHYFIPYIPAQAEDEADEETVTNYAVTTPKRGSYPRTDNYEPVYGARHQRPAYEEPEYYPKKYRIYSRVDKPPSKYYETHRRPSLNEDESEEHATEDENEDDYEYSGELNRSQDKRHMALYEDGPLFYPENGFYPRQRIRYTL